ncbi:unnamed protein product [Durusdinium trenchii]|uniref:Uncharacterized protein n=1 Tax=Durusdinium trenchii TaxID=1381693 RepID=A0ABP0I6M8_9DINO
MAKLKLRTGALMPSEVEGFSVQMQKQWARDFALPFPVWPHQSWFNLDLIEVKDKHCRR